jgi:dCTP deaminase
MPFWSGETLKQKIPAKKLVTEFEESRIDCAAYTLRMGRQFYLSAAEADIRTNKVQTLSENDSIAIPSGQFAVLLTEETVTIPTDAIAFISMKAGLKARGLVNVSGFHVDPGYAAPLRFAVFNAGPSTICIKHGEDAFLIWYADLDKNDPIHAKTENQNREYAKGITSKDVSSLSGAVQTMNILSAKIGELEKSQIWMKWFVGVLSVIGTIFIGFVIFFAQEGFRSFNSKSKSVIELKLGSDSTPSQKNN